MWMKLKKEAGRICVGEKRYENPTPKGVCIQTIRPEKDGQHTVEQIAKDGKIVAERHCYNGQQRDASWRLAQSYMV